MFLYGWYCILFHTYPPVKYVDGVSSCVFGTTTWLLQQYPWGLKPSVCVACCPVGVKGTEAVHVYESMLYHVFFLSVRILHFPQGDNKAQVELELFVHLTCLLTAVFLCSFTARNIPISIAMFFTFTNMKVSMTDFCFCMLLKQSDSRFCFVFGLY